MSGCVPVCVFVVSLFLKPGTHHGWTWETSGCGPAPAGPEETAHR